MTSPLYAANNLIIRAKDSGISMSHLKLQKLLYMLYACFYAKYGVCLFSERFEAWPYGPVLTQTYEVFKHYGSKNIGEPCKNLSGRVMIVTEEGCFKECFDDVWSKFGNHSGSALVSITHSKDSAWYKAWMRDNGLYRGFLEDVHIREDGKRWFGLA